jgi:radical SAM superfamily enzyme YgiQ (UPF0313 family)
MAPEVLLVNPNRMKPGVAPLALDYLAAALEERGFGVSLLDLCFEDDDAIACARASPAAADAILIGVTIRNTDDCYLPSQDFCLERIRPIVQALKPPAGGSPIVLGGTGFSLMPEAVLEYLGADLGIVGDGEEALCELARCIAEGRDYRHIAGLVHRSNGGWIRNAVRRADLSSLPLHRRRIIDSERYLREGGMAGIETKRGCDRRCIYCADPIAKGTSFRLRPPRSAADELQAMLARGVDHFHICDSEFNLPVEHALAVCEELTRRSLGEKLRWFTYASPAPFGLELAAAMRRAGCVGINFGVDSGDDGMLRRLGRDFTPEDLRATARLCHQEGIVFMYDLLLGGPGETRETAKRTIDLMKEVSPSRVGVSAGVRVYPGTVMEAVVRKEGFTSRNPNLRGAIEGNESLLRPVFYLSAEVGDDPFEYLSSLVERDARFFLPTPSAEGRNYNYNDNAVLVQAIRKGYRGAFWDILRRLAEEKP